METKIKFLKYLFGDTRSFPYWIFAFLMLGIVSAITYLMHPKEWLFWLQPLSILLFFLLFYTQSYFKYCKFYSYQDRLRNRNVQFEKGECVVEIFQRKIKTKPIRQNIDVKIKIPKRKSICKYIKTKDFLILFCDVLELNTFRRHIEPIVIKKDSTPCGYLKVNKHRIIPFDKNLNVEGSLCIIFANNKSEFEKINILNFDKL